MEHQNRSHGQNAVNAIEILDCPPAMADVMSGKAPRPRERQARENALRWLVDATAVWPRVIDRFGLADQWPGVKYQPDLKPPTSLGLTEFCHTFALAWHKPPESRSILLLVNADGTRCALIDMASEIARLWGNVQRPRAGRPRIETDNEKTLRQRAWREKRGSTPTGTRPSITTRNTMTVSEFFDQIMERLAATGVSPDDAQLAIKLPGRNDGFCAGAVDVHTFPDHNKGPLVIINPHTPD